MKTQIIVGRGISTFIDLFVGCDDSYRRVRAIKSYRARDDLGMDAGKIIIVRLLGNFRADGTAGQQIDGTIFLHEGGVRSSAVLRARLRPYFGGSVSTVIQS
jgi:hypothetical protein